MKQQERHKISKFDRIVKPEDSLQAPMQGPAGWPPQGQHLTQQSPAGWNPQGQEAGSQQGVHQVQNWSTPGGAEQQPAQAQMAPGGQPGAEGQADEVAPGMREVSRVSAVHGLDEHAWNVLGAASSTSDMGLSPLPFQYSDATPGESQAMSEQIPQVIQGDLGLSVRTSQHSMSSPTSCRLASDSPEQGRPSCQRSMTPTSFWSLRWGRPCWSWLRSSLAPA